ncbi:Exocyst complex component EXO70H1 [Linum perenne]
MEEDIDNAHSIITKYDSSDNPSSTTPSLFSDDRIESKKYLSAVKELQSAMQYYVTTYPSSEQLARAQNLMQKAMKKLEREFYLILRSTRDNLDVEFVSSRASVSSRARSPTASESDDESDADVTETGEEISETERASIVAMADLKAIADSMIASGYTKECVKIYHIVRKSVVDEELYRLGIDRFTSSHLHKLDWEAMESKIKTWLYAVKAAVKTLFRGERLLSDQVFSSSPAIKETCFVEVVREGALDLFGFPEYVVKGKKTLEKMFRTLDVYEAISDLWPEIESIFDFESTSSVRTLAVNSLVKLGDAVRTMLTDLETSITKDNSTAVPGGGVHPLTRYVMNYISFLSDYTVSLSDILADWPVETSSMPEAYFGSPGPDDGVTSPVSVRLAWLILVLLCKLDGKVESYNNVPLSYLFLANNLCYIVNKVRTSSIKFHLGDEWIDKHDAKVKQYAANYERLGWDKVMSSLPVNTTTATMTVQEAADCFRKFSSAFDEAYKKQSSWVVPDSKLRDEIKISLARNVGPVYRRFYEKYRTAVAREFGGVVRYAPDDLDNHWSDLFYGKVEGGSVSTSYSSSARSSVSSNSNH